MFSKDLLSQFFSSTLIFKNARELLIKIAMASSAEELMSFKSEKGITISDRFMLHLAIKRVLDAKLRAIAVNASRLAVIFGVDDYWTFSTNFDDCKTW